MQQNNNRIAPSFDGCFCTTVWSAAYINLCYHSNVGLGLLTIHHIPNLQYCIVLYLLLNVRLTWLTSLTFFLINVLICSCCCSCIICCCIIYRFDICHHWRGVTVIIGEVSLSSWPSSPLAYYLCIFACFFICSLFANK